MGTREFDHLYRYIEKKEKTMLVAQWVVWIFTALIIGFLIGAATAKGASPPQGAYPVILIIMSSVWGISTFIYSVNEWHIKAIKRNLFPATNRASGG